MDSEQMGCVRPYFLVESVVASSNDNEVPLVLNSCRISAECKQLPLECVRPYFCSSIGRHVFVLASTIGLNLYNNSCIGQRLQQHLELS